MRAIRHTAECFLCVCEFVHIICKITNTSTLIIYVWATMWEVLSFYVFCVLQKHPAECRRMQATETGADFLRHVFDMLCCDVCYMHMYIWECVSELLWTEFMHGNTLWSDKIVLDWIVHAKAIANWITQTHLLLSVSLAVCRLCVPYYQRWTLISPTVHPVDPFFWCFNATTPLDHNTNSHPIRCCVCVCGLSGLQDGFACWRCCLFWNRQE